MKKCFALLLSLLLALSAPLAMAEEIAVTAEIPAYDELIVGTTTAMNGSFFTDMWGNNTADIDVRTLLHGYNLMEWKSAMGTYGIDDSVVSGLVGVQDLDGNRTYILELYQDMNYSDGTPITAWDYAFSILLSIAPQVEQIGGATNSLNHILGIDEYKAAVTAALLAEEEAVDETEEEEDEAPVALAGVRVTGDYQLMITVKADYLPFFYEMALLDCKPYPIGVIAPGCEVADDGEGVYIRNIDPTIEEPIFTAELLQETILNAETGYLTHPSVTSGPYKLVSFDAENSVAEFEINEFYKGNSLGQVPRIPRLIFKHVANEDMIPQLVNGEVGLLNKCLNVNTVNEGMQLVTQDQISVSNYARSGYSFVSFSCEKPTTASAAVRQAIAMCFDKDTFIQNYVSNYGLRVDGYYGIGQWMYRLVAGTIEPPVEAPAADADEAALNEYEAQLAEWAELTLENVKVYNVDLEAALNLLIADGWTLNLEGEEFDPEEDEIRCKLIGETIVPLDLKMIYPEGNAIEADLQETLIDNLAKIGVKLTVEPREFTNLLQTYYRQQERDCELIYLATNFAYVFEPSSTFNPADAYQGANNRTGIVDEQLYQMAIDMRTTEPGDVLEYCQKWIAFQEHYAEVLPTLPVYSNVYFDFYTPTLHDYFIGSGLTWADAIVGAYLGDPDLVEETETEDAEILEDEPEFID